MINIFSIRCSLAFAPDLIHSLQEFIDSGTSRALVTRQGANGLTLRVDGDELVIRHQEREARLDQASAEHFLATIAFRAAHFDIVKMSSEIVLATIPPNILVSFPQSDLWLDRDVVEDLFRISESPQDERALTALPSWLVASSSSGTLMLSDQRNGKWALLSEEHLAALRQRYNKITPSYSATKRARRAKPPGIAVKGILLPLQTAHKVADSLHQFSTSGNAAIFEERAPDYYIAVSSSTEGLEIRNSDDRVGFNAREAGKWSSIIRSELERLNAVRINRGPIFTIVADSDSGRWILQFGDEILVDASETVLSRRGENVMVLDSQSAHCVMLTADEAESAGF